MTGADDRARVGLLAEWLGCQVGLCDVALELAGRAEPATLAEALA
jgi:hypothetical protein